MTKLLTTVDLYRFANPGMPKATPLVTTVDGSFVWNFEFGSLGFGFC